jgi:hypothetical protein
VHSTDSLTDARAYRRAHQCAICSAHSCTFHIAHGTAYCGSHRGPHSKPVCGTHGHANSHTNWGPNRCAHRKSDCLPHCVTERGALGQSDSGTYSGTHGVTFSVADSISHGCADGSTDSFTYSSA